MDGTRARLYEPAVKDGVAVLERRRANGNGRRGPTSPQDGFDPGGHATPQDADERLARLRAVFAQTRNPMLLFDDEGRLLEGNDAACKLLGETPRDLIGSSVATFVAPDRRAEIAPRWREFVAAGSSAGALELVRGDGSAVDVEFSATANVAPSRHLAILLLPQQAHDERADDAQKTSAAGERGGGEEPPSPLLSPRQRDVLACIAEGLDSAQAGERLFISAETVRTHVRNAMQTLGAHTRAQAVALALRENEIPLAGAAADSRRAHAAAD